MGANRLEITLEEVNQISDQDLVNYIRYYFKREKIVRFDWLIAELFSLPCIPKRNHAFRSLMNRIKNFVVKRMHYKLIRRTVWAGEQYDNRSGITNYE